MSRDIIFRATDTMVFTIMASDMDLGTMAFTTALGSPGGFISAEVMRTPCKAALASLHAARKSRSIRAPGRGVTSILFRQDPGFRGGVQPLEQGTYAID